MAQTAALGPQLAMSLEFGKSQEQHSLQTGNMPLNITINAVVFHNPQRGLKFRSVMIQESPNPYAKSVRIRIPTPRKRTQISTYLASLKNLANESKAL